MSRRENKPQKHLFEVLLKKIERPFATEAAGGAVEATQTAWLDDVGANTTQTTPTATLGVHQFDENNLNERYRLDLLEAEGVSASIFSKYNYTKLLFFLVFPPY